MYFDDSDAMVSNQWIGDSYIGLHGTAVADATMFDSNNEAYYFDENGVLVPNTWHENEWGWWLELGNGDYPTNTLFTQNGVTYLFDEYGVWDGCDKHREWTQSYGKYQYLIDGQPVTNTLMKIDGNWYYFDGGGYMYTGLFEVTFSQGNHGTEYALFKNNGAMAVDEMIDGVYYGTWLVKDDNAFCFMSRNNYVDPVSVSNHPYNDGTKYVDSDGQFIYNASYWVMPSYIFSASLNDR